MHKQRQSSVHSSKRKKTAQAAQTVRHKQHLACRTGGDEVEVNKKKRRRSRTSGTDSCVDNNTSHAVQAATEFTVM